MKLNESLAMLLVKRWCLLVLTVYWFCHHWPAFVYCRQCLTEWSLGFSNIFCQSFWHCGECASVQNINISLLNNMSDRGTLKTLSPSDAYCEHVKCTHSSCFSRPLSTSIHCWITLKQTPTSICYTKVPVECPSTLSTGLRESPLECHFASPGEAFPLEGATSAETQCETVGQ